jgi:hypothetical protein
VIADETLYRVDGEAGRFEFTCHRVMRERSVLLDTSRQVFAPLIGKGRYRTVGFKDLAIVHGVLGSSYRDTTERINRIRHQPGATPLRTLQDGVEAEGAAAAAALARDARRTLREDGIDDQTLLPVETRLSVPRERMASDRVDVALREVAPDEQTLAAMRANPVGYEDPAASVNVSIDDVLCKEQKEHRDRRDRTAAAPAPPVSADASTERPRKYVHTTVAHVDIDGEHRVFVGAGPQLACLLVMAFVVANKKQRANWMFFVDGQRSLQDLLVRVFAWQGTIQLILDWYHLIKKCKEALSSALNNRHVRNAVLKEIMPKLWYGTPEAAIIHLQQLDPKHIKSSDAIRRLIGYLERNRPHIPCYAVRKKLGLRNSSNRGEKANDLLVSARQKHNGMSWSKPGSTALATLAALVSNDNHRQWLENRSVTFRLAA